MDTGKTEKIMKRLNKRTFIYVALFVLAIVIGVALFMNRQAGKHIPSEEFVAVSGVVQHPITFESIAGASLVVGDTTVQTGEGGQFRFGAVSTLEGIRVEHPELLQAFTILPDVKSDASFLEIPFDSGLFNTLADALEDASIVITDIERKARAEFTMNGETSVYTNVIVLEVEGDKETKRYYFEASEDTITAYSWTLISMEAI